MSYKAEYLALVRRNPEVAEYRRSLLIGFLLRLALIELAVGYVSYEIARYGAPVAAIGFFVICSVVFPLFLLHPIRLFGRGYVGTITEATIERRRVAKDMDGARAAGGKLRTTIGYGWTDFCLCKVRTDAGKQRTLLLPKAAGKVFHVGTRILYVPFLVSPIPFSVQSHGVCPFCGNVYPVGSERCVGCDRSPIDVGGSAFDAGDDSVN